MNLPHVVLGRSLLPQEVPTALGQVEEEKPKSQRAFSD